eukprot:scaffold1147_cov172-Amphora_coffeaeformis.AAC.11
MLRYPAIRNPKFFCLSVDRPRPVTLLTGSTLCCPSDDLEGTGQYPDLAIPNWHRTILAP